MIGTTLSDKEEILKGIMYTVYSHHTIMIHNNNYEIPSMHLLVLVKL